MAVSSFAQTDSATQSVSTYPKLLDGDISVLSRLGVIFAPHERTPPAMSIAVDAGHIYAGNVLLEVPAQTTPLVLAPTSNPRIDRVVIDKLTGIVSMVTGTESVTPAAPSIPTGNVPVARIALEPSTTAIGNGQIIDERSLNSLGESEVSGGLLNVKVFAASGVYIPSPGTKKIVVEVQGGGASAGGTAAQTSSSGSATSGASAGAYAKGMIASGFSGVPVTIGAGGASPLPGNNDGKPGGTSSFGSLIVAPGGNPSIGGGTPSIPMALPPGPPSLVATGGNIVNSAGAPGSSGIITVIGSVVGSVGGNGGSSQFGGGGGGLQNQKGRDATSPGAGGGGSGGSIGTANTGGAGAAGIVIIHEYA